MSHELVEKTAGLASRVDNLVALQTGDDCRTLERQQERLEKLTLAAIAEKLDASSKEYQTALAALDAAIQTIGEAEKGIQNVTKVIGLVAKAADLVEQVLKAAAA